MEVKLRCLGFRCKTLSIKEIGASVRVGFLAARVNLFRVFCVLDPTLGLGLYRLIFSGFKFNCDFMILEN